MRTQEEILQKIKDVEKEDFFGTIRDDLLQFLKFENAKQFLLENTEEEWREIYKEPSEENIKKEMREYLGFAFGKAEDERGLSAGRSMQHYYGWIWLLDKEDYFGDVRDYSKYGIPYLNMIKEYLNEL